ncbi:Protein roadkill, partial [Araneus ventricosus]
NLFWKIKNFSYGSEVISSPEFILDGDLWRLDIEPKYVECRLVVLSRDHIFQRQEYLLSFLPCDGSSPLISYGCCLQVSKEILFRTRRSAFLPDDTLTVRFQFPTASKRGNLFVQSQIGVKRKCFLWSLKKFNKDQYNEKDMKISAENSNRYGIVELCLKSMDGINSDDQFYIEISRTHGEQCYCVLKVSVLDMDGKAVNCMSDEFLFENQDSQEKWKFSPIIKKSKLFACKDLLLPNGTLTLKCDIAISLGTTTDQTAVLSYFEDVIPLLQESEDLSKCFKEKSSLDSVSDLQSDLKKILDSETFSDVSLQVSSEVIRAHKAILGARSSVFKYLLTDDTKENNVNNVVIEDLDVETLRRLLLYMYTGTINNYQESNIKNLYFAADIYQVPSLKQKCSSFLKAKLSVSNICGMLALADSYEDADLEKAVLDFISTYHSEVFASKEWKNLEERHSSLAFQALRKICSNKRFD